jgi:predicted ATPase
MAITHTHQGNFGLALEHSERALALCGSDGAGDNLFGDALNPGVAIRCFASWCLWFTSHADRALVRIQDAVALARRFSEPHGLAHALFFAAVLHQLRRDRVMAHRCADEVLVLAGDHGLVLYGAAARIVRGWAFVGRGDDEGAAEEIRQGLAAWQATGAQLMKPHFLTLLADAYAAANHYDQALRLLDEALMLANASGERMYETEIVRLRDECLSQILH